MSYESFNLPLILRLFTGIHVLYGIEALIYKVSVLSLCVSWSIIIGVTFHADNADVHEAMRSLFFCAAVIRIATPLQSVSALFIADIGRYIGHTAAELQEIRAGLIVLARGVRFLLWLGSSGLVAARCGADPLVVLSGFGAGTLFIGLALHKSVEHALAVVSLLMSAPFKVGDYVRVAGGHLGQVVKIGFRTTHIRLKYDGQIVQVPNATLASTTVENLSSFEVRRGRLLLRLVPGQPVERLDAVKGLVQGAFRDPAIANWQQYLTPAAAAAAADDEDARAKKGANASGLAKTASGKSSGPPTQLEDLGFVEIDSGGALEFEIVYVVPYEDVAPFKQVRHEVMVGVMRALQGGGVELAHQLSLS